jgi:TatD DNase family protein
MYIDTHTHLYSEEFDADREERIHDAIAKLVSKFYMPNVDSASIDGMLKLEQQFPEYCFPMMGLHPCSVNQTYVKELEIVKEWLDKRRFAAIGEIGMDLYWDKTYLAEQKEALKIQATWAIALDLPLILHVRNAFDEVFEVLDEVNCPALKGVFHCFSGNAQQAERATSYGDFYLGIGGVVTYKNGGLDDALKDIPLDVILLETDAPYLSPEPHRGKGSRNEPAYVVHVADKLCSIYRCSIQHLSQQTETNVNKLFKHAI